MPSGKIPFLTLYVIEFQNVFVVKSPIIAEGISQLKHGLDDDICPKLAAFDHGI